MGLFGFFHFNHADVPLHFRCAVKSPPADSETHQLFLVVQAPKMPQTNVEELAHVLIVEYDILGFRLVEPLNLLYVARHSFQAILYIQAYTFYFQTELYWVHISFGVVYGTKLRKVQDVIILAIYGIMIFYAKRKKPTLLGRSGITPCRSL